MTTARRSIMFAAAMCASLFVAQLLNASQHLVSPGDNWSNLASKAQPGDEILLLPGRHRSALLLDLLGTAEAPITIRSLDPKRPAVIIEQREGLRLIDSSHVHIRDLQIADSTANGLAITDRAAHLSPLPTLAPGRTPGSSSILIERVLIQRTGPTGLRHAIVLHNASNIEIRDCMIEGWGGSAVEVVASSEIDIRECRFAGLDDFSQIAGVRVRAGSHHVHVDHCRFRTLSAAFCFGAASDETDWRLTDATLITSPDTDGLPGPSRADKQDDSSVKPPATEPRSPRAEAVDCIMERCIVENVSRPIIFQCASACIARNNTIANVRRSNIVVLPPVEGAAPCLTDDCTIAANIFTWKAGDLQSLAEFDAAQPLDSIVIGQNLWWSLDDAETRAKLGSLPGRVEPHQVMDVDPKLDSTMSSTNPEADLFGIHAP